MNAEAGSIVKRARVLAYGVIACLLAGAVVVFVLRARQASALAEAADVHARQYVTTIVPTPGGHGLPLSLPGTLQGINEATVYARSNGYSLRWSKDIGASVKQGELLAEISAPEIESELAQAVAA